MADMPQIPAGGTGAATPQTPQMGAAAQALALVRAGLELFQRGLQGLPMGSKIHTAVMRSMIDVTRNLDSEGSGASAATQQLMQLARQAQAQPQQAAALERLQGAQDAGAGAAPPAGAGAVTQ